MKKISLIISLIFIISIDQSKAEGEYIIGFYYGSYLLMPVNLFADVGNIVQIKRNSTKNRIVPLIGIASGTMQILYGVGFLEFFGDQVGPGLTRIGIGASTVVLSIWNLHHKNKIANSKSSWNFKTFPLPNKQTVFGLSITHHF